MTSHAPEWSAEQRAVLEIIEADLDSYLARDKGRWTSNWVSDARFQSFMECGTLQIANGFAAFQQNMFEAMDAEPAPIDADIRRENVRIDVRDGLAWITFDQIVSDTENPLAPPNFSHNFRLLEKSAEGWRILFHGVWSQPQRDAKTPIIEVTADCQIVWLNHSAVDELKRFPGLTNSNGRLRASKPALDKAFSDVVAQAHELTSFGKFNVAASESGAVTFPVVLGEDIEGALLMCWVKVTDGRVYVLFGESPDLTKQIEVAQVIYGLSNAQVETIRLIANGLELSEIADTLGVTINTTKTHLSRAFEKVGVNSQVELLRRLVSFSV